MGCSLGRWGCSPVPGGAGAASWPVSSPGSRPAPSGPSGSSFGPSPFWAKDDGCIRVAAGAVRNPAKGIRGSRSHPPSAAPGRQRSPRGPNLGWPAWMAAARDESQPRLPALRCRTPSWVTHATARLPPSLSRPSGPTRSPGRTASYAATGGPTHASHQAVLRSVGAAAGTRPGPHPAWAGTGEHPAREGRRRRARQARHPSVGLSCRSNSPFGTRRRQAEAVRAQRAVGTGAEAAHAGQPACAARFNKGENRERGR